MNEIQDYEHTEIAASAMMEGEIFVDPEDATLHRVARVTTIVLVTDPAGRQFAFTDGQTVMVI